MRTERTKQREITLVLRDTGRLDFEAHYRPVRGGHELEAVRLLPSADHRKSPCCSMGDAQVPRLGQFGPVLDMGA